jgi:DNA repair protein RadD
VAISSQAIHEALTAFGLDPADSGTYRAVRRLSDQDGERAGKRVDIEFDVREVLRPKEIRLFDYQQEIVEKLVGLPSSDGVGLVSLPTGAGKTRTAIAACLEMQRRGVRNHVIWMAPSRELCAQARSALHSVWDSAPLGHPVTLDGLQGSVRDRATWRVGTIQAAVAMAERLEALGKETVLVFDEAHQATAPTYRRVVRRLRRSGAVIIGLSATPGRYTDKETRELSELFEGRLITPRCLGSDPIRSLRERGVLAAVQREALATPGDQSPIRKVERLAERIMELRCCPGLAFVARTLDAYVVAALLARRGVRAEVVSHEQSAELRAEKLSRLRRNQLDWIVNVEVLATGIDIPTLRAVALLTEIGSPILYEQILGRISRGVAVGGQERTLVLDAFDHFKTHGDASSYSRFLPIAW